MKLGQERGYVSVILSGYAQHAYTAYCLTYDTVGELANAMARIEEQWSILPKEERPDIDIELAAARLDKAFFSLNEARGAVDSALAVLADNGIDLPRFPERA